MFPITEAPELIKPTITIYDYTNGIYKIIKFKSSAARLFVSPDKFNHYDEKLDSSLSRARRAILEYALCNDWSYFCTFTLSPDKGCRQDLNAWHKRFTQWLRDQRKIHIKAGYDFPLKFLLVPELHDDGKTWHMHGLFSDISPVLTSFADLYNSGMNVPLNLVKNGYLNWSAYQQKFGFCSFARIKDPVACAFYVTKYMNKEINKTSVDLGCSLYYNSRPLNRAKKHGDIYGYTSYFDDFLTNHYEFCDTGMTHSKNNLDWSFGLEYMDFEPLTFGSEGSFPEVDSFVETSESFLQLSFAGGGYSE